MIILGIILLVIWYLTAIAVLKILGLLLLVIGVVLLALGAMGNTIGPRRYYF